ncbi:MAG TPA: ABC transporter substrate-binding protein [Azospirillaceae bacterium]|nr:ABC transporter substrate-binding protein [Azospirillaceae bacterium]
MPRRRDVLYAGLAGAAVAARRPAVAATAVAPALPPDVFVARVAQDVLDAVFTADPDRRLAELVRQHVDLRYAARFALGRYWGALSPRGRSDYLDAYQAFSLAVLPERILRHLDPRKARLLFGGPFDAAMVLQPAGPVRQGARDVVVPTVLTLPVGDPTLLEWRLRAAGRDWKLIDLAVDKSSQALVARAGIEGAVAAGGGDPVVIVPWLRARIAASR